MDQAAVDAEFFGIVADLVDSSTELIDPAAGAVVGHAATSLWGQSVWTGAGTPLRFPGQYFDDESGLHYNRYRYYAPDTARYLSLDPLGLAPSPNPSTYPHNPTGWTDPLGLTPCVPCEKPSTQLIPKPGADYVAPAFAANRNHILYGDSTGGGDLWPGLSGKMPFPRSWSADRVMHEIFDVATDPKSTFTAGRCDSTIVTGMRDGANIRVVLRNNEIIMSYPTNLPRHP